MRGIKYHVYTPTDISPKPEKTEVIVAEIMASYLKK